MFRKFLPGQKKWFSYKKNMYVDTNLEDLIENMTHQLIQTPYSRSELIY